MDAKRILFLLTFDKSSCILLYCEISTKRRIRQQTIITGQYYLRAFKVESSHSAQAVARRIYRIGIREKVNRQIFNCGEQACNAGQVDAVEFTTVGNEVCTCARSEKVLVSVPKE